MNPVRFPEIAVLLSLLLVGHVSAQFNALSISTDRTTVQAGEEVKFKLDSNGPFSYCGIHVEYQGSSESPTFIRMNHQGSKFPHAFSKTFSAPGTVVVTAKGERVSSALGCPGSASVTLNVVAPSPPPSAVNENPVEDLRASAIRGNVTAMTQLGNYLASQGEDKEALLWFERAARAGSSEGMTSAAILYQEGRGAPQDHGAAAKWYANAAKLGNPYAMRNLGVLYLKGLGVAEDKSLAYVHFSLGATYAKDKTLRSELAQARDEVAKSLPWQDLAKAQEDARRLADQIK